MSQPKPTLPEESAKPAESGRFANSSRIEEVVAQEQMEPKGTNLDLSLLFFGPNILHGIHKSSGRSPASYYNSPKTRLVFVAWL